MKNVMESVALELQVFHSMNMCMRDSDEQVAGEPIP